MNTPHTHQGDHIMDTNDPHGLIGFDVPAADDASLDVAS